MPHSILLSIALLAAPTAQQGVASTDAPAGAPAGAQTANEAVASTPVPVYRILAMRPFELDVSFESEWRAERPTVRSGWLMAIEVDRPTSRSRQMAMPVLYVGDQVAERLNEGGPASVDASPEILRLVVIVPAPIAGDGSVTQPLRERPAFFGAPALPEQVNADWIALEVAAAAAAGLKAPSTEALEAALAQGGPMVRATDRAALLTTAAALLRTWSPTERDQADLLEGKPIATSPRAQPDA